METAVAAKSEEKKIKKSSPRDHSSKPHSSAQAGASAGMPLFLQSSTALSSPADRIHPQTKDNQTEKDITEEFAVDRQETTHHQPTLMSSEGPRIQPQFAATGPALFQRQMSEDELDSNAVLENLEGDGPIQTTLTLGQPDDPHEREADQVADQVMAQRPVTTISRLSGGGLRRTRQNEGKEENEFIQPFAKSDRLPDSEKNPQWVQAKSQEDFSHNAAETVDSVHHALQHNDSGTPMHAGTRQTLEANLGTDLTSVRLHEDTQSHQANHAIHARAFTNSNHIWLGKGESQTDLRLMAHETTHVLQQGGVISRQPLNPGAAGSEGGTAPTSPSSPASSPAAPATENGAPSSEQTSTVAVEPEPASSEEENASPAQEQSQSQNTGAAGGAEEGAGGASPEGGTSVIELLMPEPPRALSAAERAELDQVHNRASTAATQVEDLPPADSQVTEARNAVEEPEAETAAREESALMDALDERPAPSPEIEDLCQQIYDVIHSKRPPDEDSLVEADPEEMASAAGGQLNDDIQSDADRVAGSYDQLENPPEGPAPAEPQDMDPSPESVDTSPLGATTATPEGVAPEAVSLDADLAASQTQIEEAGMTSAPAKLAPSGPIADARAAQEELGEAAARDPAEVLAEQQAMLSQTRGDMAALQERALAALNTARSTTVSGTTTQQTNMVQSEEQTRDQISARAQGIFNDAKTQVDTLLEPLARTAMEQWNAEVTVLSHNFKQDLLRVKGWVDERHSGLGGSILGVLDSVTGLPGWVTEEYDAAEKAFGDGACELIRKISTDVNAVIATCEALITNARTDIAELFANLPADLQEWATGEQARLNEQLDQLHNQTTETQENFNRDLTNSAAQAVQEVREEVHQLREAAKGLIGRIADSIGRFLDDPAKFIIEGLLELLGIPPASFWALVNRIGSVINDIADDPLGFANNLASALGQGFQQFFDNFADHILGGFFDWLFSGLGAVGVNIPSDFSLKSIITFFLELMGITWPNIRELLARHIGEENVALIEQAYELVANLIEMGPEGIFEMIKEQLNPQNILDMVVDAAIEFMMDALIAAVTPRVIAMFNPAGAILQAIEVVFRILSWIFENAARIFSLVETVVNGAAALVAGNIGGMATAVEGALSGLLAPVIDFLAGFLGMGDLPDKIAETIRGFQQSVMSILERVVAWLAERGKALLASLGIGGEEEGAAVDENGGLSEIGGEFPVVSDNERHTLDVEVSGNQGRLVLHSATEEVGAWLTHRQAAISDKQWSQDQVGEAERLIAAAEDLLPHADGLVDAIVAARQTADQQTITDHSVPSQSQATAGSTDNATLTSEQQTLAAALSAVLGSFETEEWPAPRAGIHTVPEEATLPEGSPPRESHHVPALALAESLSNELGDAIGVLAEAPNGVGNQAAQTLSNRKDNIDGAVVSRGERRLSAILIHQETHRTGDTAVHRTTIRQEVESRLAREEAETGEDRTRILTGLGQRLSGSGEDVTRGTSVNPRAGAWRRFIANVATALSMRGADENQLVWQGYLDETRQALEAKDNEEEAELDRTVKADVSQLLDAVYTSAWASGRSAVEGALAGSTKDGTPADHAAATGALRGVADASWAPIIGPL